MLQLLEHLDKPLASLAILAGVLFTLAQTAKTEIQPSMRRCGTAGGLYR